MAVSTDLGLGYVSTDRSASPRLPAVGPSDRRVIPALFGLWDIAVELVERDDVD